MRARCSATRLHPFPIPPQEGVLLLGASQRNAEIIVCIIGGAVSLRADHFEQVPLDVFLVKGDAIDLGQSFRLAAFGQQLQGADAVPADSREQVERLKRARLEPGRNAFANDVTVRQQALKVVCNTGTLQWLITQIERQRQRDRAPEP